MKSFRLFMLMLVPMFSAQASAQTDTVTIGRDYDDVLCDTVVMDVSPSNFDWDNVPQIVPQTDDDNALQVLVKGFLDTYHSVRTQGKDDLMASRTRARGEVKLEKGAASLFVSLNATYNGILKERTGLELREAYLSYAKGNLDLRMGRQIIVWGVADALRVTDCVSPFDYTEFLAQDYDDIRMPVNAFRAKYTWRSMTFEVVCIPVSDFFVLPTDTHNPWSMRPTFATLPYIIDLESGKPQKRLCNIEFGGRVCMNLSGIDLSVSALQTWNKMPALGLFLSSDRQTLLATGQYHRMTMLGGDCSLPVEQLVLRAEAACYLGEAQGAELGFEVARRNAVNALVGVDWYPGNDWNVSAQYCHKCVSGNIAGLSIHRNTALATARIGKEMLRNTLKLSSFAYIDVTNGGIFNRFSTSYSLNDQIELTVGYDYFHADKGTFAMYRHNSEAWLKMKYSF